jgi:hypothetical protein
VTVALLCTAVVLFILGVACLAYGLAGLVSRPDPVDEHAATLPDLRPWLPGDPRDEMTGDEAQAILRRLAPDLAVHVQDAIDQGHTDYDLYRDRQHLPGEHHYSEGTP